MPPRRCVPVACNESMRAVSRNDRFQIAAARQVSPARPPPPRRRRTLLPGFDIPGRTIGVRDARPCPRHRRRPPARWNNATPRRGRRMSKKKADHATDELIERMLSHLEERRRHGDGAYPPTLEELATLCEIPPTSPQLAKAAKSKAFTTRAVVASKGKLLPEAPVVLTDNAADEAVVMALSQVRQSPREGERARPPRSPSSGTGWRRPCTSRSRRGGTAHREREVAERVRRAGREDDPRPRVAAPARGRLLPAHL